MFPQDLIGIAPHVDQQLFFTGGANWQTWRKPEGKCFAWMIAIGGAGGGAGGTNSTSGGGGGGSGGLARLLIPLWMLPDTLYIQVGLGGIGTTVGVNGNSGTSSFISLQPNSTAANCYLASGHTAAGGGTTSGTGGSAEIVATVADCILASFGNFIAIAGVAGGNQNLSVTALATIPLSGGVAGALGNSMNITGAGLIPTITGGVGSPISPPATNGGNGITLGGSLTGFMACGGAGGGGGTSNNGGNGGNGGFGSGGGGGGGSAASGTGGNGGNGGNGFVGIWCF